jgi:hypothetical protein
MQSFQSSQLSDVEALRTKICESFASIEAAAQGFARTLATCCPTTVLARVFIVLPLSKLSPSDRKFAAELVSNDRSLSDKTPVLCLLGTAGREARWCDRTLSVGHRAIPLLGAAFVQSVPMLAKLFADLDVSLLHLDDGKTLDMRRLPGGLNEAFYVDDARVAEDARGRRVIPSKDFVDEYGVRTVFGMGGAYVDGTLAVAIVFTSESIDRKTVDRFPSLISSFKTSTATLLRDGRLYRESVS